MPKRYVNLILTVLNTKIRYQYFKTRTQYTQEQHTFTNEIKSTTKNEGPGFEKIDSPGYPSDISSIESH